MPTRSSSLLTGLGFLMFSLFRLNSRPEAPSQQDCLVMALSGACSLLSWAEVVYSEQYQSCQALTFCLNTLTLGLALWLALLGLLSLLQVSIIVQHYIIILHFAMRCVWAPRY